MGWVVSWLYRKCFFESWSAKYSCVEKSFGNVSSSQRSNGIQYGLHLSKFLKSLVGDITGSPSLTYVGELKSVRIIFSRHSQIPTTFLLVFRSIWILKYNTPKRSTSKIFFLLDYFGQIVIFGWNCHYKIQFRRVHVTACTKCLANTSETCFVFKFVGNEICVSGRRERVNLIVSNLTSAGTNRVASTWLNIHRLGCLVKG